MPGKRKDPIALGTNVRWFLLDTIHGAYNGIIVDCGNRHKRNWPNNILSIVLSDDGTRALVKSDSMDAPWRAGRWAENPGGSVLDIYDNSDHHRALTLLSGPDWSNTREGGL